MIDVDGNQDPGFGQAQNCGSVKLIKVVMMMTVFVR